jgi:hypothetical protein
VKPGDVFEIATPRGLAHFQCVLRVPKYSDLIRILPGLLPKTPAEYSQLVRERELYFVYFPLGAAARRGIVRKVGHEPIPPGSGKPAKTRRAGARARGGQVLAWIIEEGNRERLARELRPEEKLLSVNSIWNDTLLIERICKGGSLATKRKITSFR